MEGVFELSKSYRCTHVGNYLSLEGDGVRERRCTKTASVRFSIRWEGGGLNVRRMCPTHADRFRHDLIQTVTLVRFSEVSI